MKKVLKPLSLAVPLRAIETKLLAWGGPSERWNENSFLFCFFVTPPPPNFPKIISPLSSVTSHLTLERRGGRTASAYRVKQKRERTKERSRHIANLRSQQFSSRSHRFVANCFENFRFAINHHPQSFGWSRFEMRVFVCLLACLAVAVGQNLPLSDAAFRGNNRVSAANNGVRESRQQRRECAAFDGGINMCKYETHKQMLAKLRRLESEYPGLAQVGSVGTSVRGRDLAYIKIRYKLNANWAQSALFHFHTFCSARTRRRAAR